MARAAQVENRSLTPDEHLTLAHRAHDGRRFAEAAARYRLYLASGGSMRTAGLTLGDALREAGDLPGALDVYAAAFEANPQDPAVTVRLGEAARRRGHADLARAAWRAAAERGGDGFTGVIGGELPLPDALDAQTAARLSAGGWPVLPSAVAAPAAPLKPPAPAGLPPAPRALRLTGLDAIPAAARPSLLASLAIDALDGAALDRAARLCDALDPGRALVVAHVVARPDAPEVHDLRRLVHVRGLPVAVATHDPGADRAAMRNFDLRLATAFGADALVFDAVPEGAGASLAGVFGDDPLLGFASWTWSGARTAGERPGPSPWRRGPARPGVVTLVRGRVLAEAGLLDAVYDDPEQALLDLMLRANRLGFGAVSCEVAPAANGFAPPAAEADPVDARILRSRYPEHADALRRASGSPMREADRLLAGRADPRSLALDLSGLRAWHDGTAELAVALTRALAREGRFDVTAICAPDAARHHRLHALPGVAVAPVETRSVFGACLKVGQPFTWAELLRTWSYAPVAGFYMLDAISLDVERLNIADLHPLWSMALGCSELVGHLSAATRDRMGERFGEAGRRGFVALCSTAADEYGGRGASSTGDGPVLLVGNAYEHKNLLGAVRAIHAVDPARDVTVLGRVLEPRPHVRWLDSGGLHPDALDQLYDEAAAVVFPSLSEGFGLPIMHGLARGKAVLAVDQPVFREVRERSRLGANLHLFPTTRDLAEGLEGVCRAGPAPAAPDVREHRWADAARIVADAAALAVASFDPAALERRAAVAGLARRGERD